MTTVCKRKGKVLAHEGESVRAVFYVIAGGLIVTARDPGIFSSMCVVEMERM